MSGFKLLAIRPLKDCDPKFLKNLKEGMVYKFYQDYKFYSKNKDGKEIEINELNYLDFVDSEISRIDVPENEIDLYSSSDDMKINISAVVGKNGSGKSSLLELFYLSVYLTKYRYLIEQQIKKQKSSKIKYNVKDNFEKIIKNNKELLNKVDLSDEHVDEAFLKGLSIFKSSRIRIEIFYQITSEFDKSIYRIEIDTSDINSMSFDKNELFQKTVKKCVEYPVPTHEFYSIALNYSIHSLNSQEIGLWVGSIFHKNDGYQTPLVINPKRELGSIDIEIENDLQKSRLLVNTMNILSNDPSADTFLNGKVIKSIKFKLSLEGKYRNQGYDVLMNDGKYLNIPINQLDTKTKKKIHIVQEKLALKDYNSCNWLEKEVFHYILYKLDRIFKNYKELFVDCNGFSENFNNLQFINSHITFKLNQSINFINNDGFIKQRFLSLLEQVATNSTKSVLFLENEKISKLKFDLMNDEDFQEIYSVSSPEKSKEIEFLPPPIFEYDFHFSDVESDTFNQLSSGEKQQIYTLHTIMYHIRNIASVEPIGALQKYHYINLILDEIELYFHPEMQRMFLKRLLLAIKNMEGILKNNIEGINIILATHSPFILSDIPIRNVLRLENGIPTQQKSETFGANIHDLLANDFFLEKGFMGEFSKERINDVIKFLTHEINSKEILLLKVKKDKVNHEKDKLKYLRSSNKFLKEQLKDKNINSDSAKKIIDVIGEPLIKEKLLQMLNLI